MNLENRNTNSEQSLLQEQTFMPTPAAEYETNSAYFDCNICLEFVRDPVITFCGHLFCWPCIYKWFNWQRTSLASGNHPQCPVCKDEISEKFMVPLYGRGGSLSQCKPKGKVIPPRPQARRIKDFARLFSTGQKLASRYRSQNQQRANHHINPAGDLSPSLVSVRRTSAVAISWPTAGMLWQKIEGNLFEDAADLKRFLRVVTRLIGVWCGFILCWGIYMAGRFLIDFSKNQRASASSYQSLFQWEMQMLQINLWMVATTFSSMFAGLATKMLKRKSSLLFVVVLYSCGFLVSMDRPWMYDFGAALVGCACGLFGATIL